MRMLADLLVVLLLGACSDVKTLDAAAMEKRRIMNDMQARATMAAVCDISLGAYFRELNMNGAILAWFAAISRSCRR
jgi:hypothetical protein